MQAVQYRLPDHASMYHHESNLREPIHAVDRPLQLDPSFAECTSNLAWETGTEITHFYPTWAIVLVVISWQVVSLYKRTIMSWCVVPRPEKEACSHYTEWSRRVGRWLQSGWSNSQQAGMCLDRFKTRARWPKIGHCAHSGDRKLLQVDFAKYYKGLRKGVCRFPSSNFKTTLFHVPNFLFPLFPYSKIG